MKPTNDYFRTRRRLVELKLQQCRFFAAHRERPAGVEELLVEREILDLVLLNRRLEASRPIVDLGRWRTANGAGALASEKSKENSAFVRRS